jgi:type II secretory pathway pseudopilin PulG
MERLAKQIREDVVKKADRISHNLEEALTSGVKTAREWATPRVETARVWVAPHVETAQVWAGPRVETALGWAVPKLEKGLETASPKVQESLRKAAHATAEGVATVTPKIQESLDKLAPRIAEVIDGAAPKIQGRLDKATPALATAKEKVVGLYLPALSDKFGVAAEAVSKALDSAQSPEQVELIVAKLTGNKKAIAKAQKAAAEAAKQAAEQARREQRRGGKGWLIFGVIAAAGAAGVAAWKASQPVEDPWKSPAPVAPGSANTPTPTPVATTAEPAPAAAPVTVSADDDSAANGGESAKHVAGPLGDDEAETTGGANGTGTPATDAKTAMHNIAAASDEKIKPTDS